MGAHETMSAAEWAEWQAAAEVPKGVGGRLENGAVVLQVRPSRHPGGTAFLALWRGEFVTWIGRADGSGTSWGHYFETDLAAALSDFAERATA